MKIQYSNIPGEPWIDTDSKSFEERADWIARVVGAKSWRVSKGMIYLTHGGNEIVNVVGYVHFAMPDFPSTQEQAGEYVADVAAVFRSPDSVAVGIRAETDQPFDPTLKYIDPNSGKQINDWEAPGAVIGPPLASSPGHYQFRHTGQKPGERTTGASGRQYELVQVGNFAFFTMHAWRGL